METGLMWALSMPGISPATSMVGGGASLLAGLVVLAAQIAWSPRELTRRRAVRRGLVAIASMLLLAGGGIVLLGELLASQQARANARQVRLLERQTKITRDLLVVSSDLARRTSRIQTDLLTHAILGDPRHKDPKKLNHYEYKLWSQNGEDGIIAEIFRRIGTTNRYFVEFGASNGTENNTVLLVRQGWSGLWMDADTEAVKKVHQDYRSEIDGGRLTALETFITAENIEDLFRQARVPEEMDLLSIDIDRNDYHVWEKITHYRPRVVIVEYNAIIPPSTSWVVPYDAKAFGWAKYGDIQQNGASLKALEELGARKGYSLVGCDLCGVNAFFVRNDLLGDHFLAPYTAENHHEPFRFNYLGGHYPAVRFP